MTDDSVGPNDGESALWGVVLWCGLGLELVLALIIAGSVFRAITYLNSYPQGAGEVTLAANAWATPATAGTFVFLPLFVAAAYVIWCTTRDELPKRWGTVLSLLGCCIAASVLALWAGAYGLGYALAHSGSIPHGWQAWVEVVTQSSAILFIGIIGGVVAYLLRRDLLRFILENDLPDEAAHLER